MFHDGEIAGQADWALLGLHNLENALAALSAAVHAGVSVEVGLEALSKFKGVKRRLEKRGVFKGITLYDDFAHHPTAIEMTLQALTKRLAIGEVPIEYGSRQADSPSKLNTWGDGWLIVKCIVLLFKDYRPLVFFVSLASLLAMASLVVGSAPIRDYIETSYVLHVPRAILASGLAILALTALTAGLILDTVVRLHEETVEFWKQQLDDRR